MLNIENEILENIDTSSLLPLDNDTFEIKALIDKYNLNIDEAILSAVENQYIAITSFIVNLYLDKKPLPEDIKEFIQKSFNYKVFLISDIKNRMKSIISETSVHLFKEIYIILNLLSNGHNYQLLKKDNTFSLENLQTMLKDYEDNICELYIKKDEQSFELYFKFYITVLEVLNQNCVINSIDIKGRKNITSILELITNTISNLKNKIELSPEYKKSLNSILGQQLLYFTDMSFIDIDLKNKDLVIQKYAFMINKICDGYELLQNDEKYYITFLDRLTTLILTLIYKLKTKLNILNIDFDKSKELEDILELYNKNVLQKHRIDVDNLNDFREELIKNYNYIYDVENPIDFFINKDEISNIDLIVIHNIVLFSEKIEKEKLDLLVKSLLEKNRFDNDYYEFYKLKIIDRVLQIYISMKIESSKNLLIPEIIKYIEKNNLISHVMNMYIKIYLTLALYYSGEKILTSQEKSKEFYFIYKRLDNNNFLENEFSSINRQILFNYTANYFNQFNFKNKIGLSSVELLRIGRDQISRYINSKEIEIRNKSLIKVEELLSEILEIKEPNDQWLNKKLEKLITNKIFFGLIKSKIVNKEQLTNENEVGYDSYNIELENDYVLNLYYSSYYKTTFENILLKNKSFLELLVGNIFKSYINSIPSFTDITTKLPNINKLKSDLKKLDDEKIIFAEVYLNSVVEFSNEHNVKTSNEFYKTLTDCINEQYNTYRLFGPKIGIILKEDQNYNDAISFLQELTFKFENKDYKINPTIAISIGQASNILDKSFYSLSSAKLSNKKLFIYE